MEKKSKPRITERLTEMLTIYPEYIGNDNRIVIEFYNNYDPEYSISIDSVVRMLRRMRQAGTLSALLEKSIKEASNG